MNSKIIFTVIGISAIGAGYFFGSHGTKTEVSSRNNAPEEKNVEAQSPTASEARPTTQNLNSTHSHSMTALTSTPPAASPVPTEAYHNPLYDNPEAPADPNLVRQRDDEENSLHELQHQVLPPAEVPAETPVTDDTSR